MSEKYPTLQLKDKSVSAYKSSERGDMANCYSPLQNLDKTDTGRGAFTSDGLQWNQFNPIQMDIVPEYDGSVNIIMNDDLNDPKMINSGFSVLENNTYLIPEHLGNAITNIYDEDTIEGDTALFKLYDRIPKLTFNGLRNGGAMLCGSYTFYFRLSDADGNVTNIVQESSIVQVHMGDPGSAQVRMGQEDENAQKQISFTLTNLDKTFDYVRVFYERTSSNGESKGAVTRYHMIDKNYPIENSTCEILITGAERVFDELTLQDILTQYADIQSAKTQTIELNILFLGNVSSYELNYKKLRNLAWKIIPSEILSPDLGHITPNYKFIGGAGYYDVQNVYNYTGYWADELYRFGVVFIYGNNRVSNVFNVQGCDFQAYTKGTDKKYFCRSYDGEHDYEWWDYDPDDHIFHNPLQPTNALNNSKGVFRFSNNSTIDAGVDYSIKAKGIRFDFSEIIDDLKELDIKGLFFVRQKRVPTILGQGVVIGLTDKDRGSLPVIRNEGSYVTKSFLNKYRMLGGGTVTQIEATNQALLLPDGELQEPIYNDIINSQDFYLIPTGILGSTQVEGDHFSLLNSKSTTASSLKVKLTTVPQGTKNITNGTDYFSTRAGYAEDAVQVVDVKHVWNCTHPQDLTESTSLVRGEFGYYVGMSANDFLYGTIVNIKESKWADEGQINLAFEERFGDSSAYFSVSPRYNLSDFTSYLLDCFRGDCFSSVFTHKMMSNFADPELPTNTTIIDPKCWAKNFVVRATAIREADSYNNCKKGSDGFWDTTSDLSMINGAPPYQNSIAEEVTLDVIYYPMSITADDTSSIKKYSDNIDTSDALDDTIYQDDVMIGEVVNDSDYGIEDSISNLLSFSILLPITSIIACVKRASNHITTKERAYKCLHLTLPQPVKVGSKLLDAFITVSTSKKHNYVKRGRTNINRSDVNAVSIGQWVTFPICSSLNLAMRDIDFSNTTEEAAHNRKRSFYPYEGMDPKVHLLEAKSINDGARKSISTNGVAPVANVPFIRQEFFNRIYWSKPNVTDTIINNYRLVYSNQFIEYNKEWGAITKVVPYAGYLLVVFQHGMGITPITTSPQTKLESSQYAASVSVLQTALSPVSHDEGSMWLDSVISVNSGTQVFGVDTVAKKIWVFQGNALSNISDFKVEKFLIDFIDLSEFDFNEYLGHINVKTHFNAFKNDVIFTFYKDKANWILPEDEDLKAEWAAAFTKHVAEDSGMSVLYESLTLEDNKITFYYKYLGDDTLKNTKYIIRKGGIYDYENRRLAITPIIGSWSTGTTWSLCYNLNTKTFVTFYDWYPLLSENIDNVWFTFDKEQFDDVLNNEIDGITNITTLPGSFKAEKVLKSTIKSAFNNYVMQFICTQDCSIKMTAPYNAYKCWYYNDSNSWEFNYIKPGEVEEINVTKGHIIADIHTVTEDYLISVGALKDGKLISFNEKFPYYHLENSSTKETMKLWKHGRGGLYDGESKIKPTNWYGKQHEFNFEFIAKSDEATHKIWDNLVIISNKAEPAKFEFEVVGETYNWHEYKPIIDWINNQEENPSDPDYWWKYVLGKTASEIQEKYEDFPDFYAEELYGNNNRVIQKLPYLKLKLTDKKGTPERPIYSWDPESPKNYWEKINLSKHPKDKFSYNCSEVCLKEDDALNEQRVHSEQLGNNVRKYGRVRGNMEYREDNWKVEIRPILFKWCYLDGYDTLAFKTTETRNRDKYIKIKVRYSGEDLAIISAIATLYEDSYA